MAAAMFVPAACAIAVCSAGNARSHALILRVGRTTSR